MSDLWSNIIIIIIKIIGMMNDHGHIVGLLVEHIVLNSIIYKNRKNWLESDLISVAPELTRPTFFVVVFLAEGIRVASQLWDKAEKVVIFYQGSEFYDSGVKSRTILGKKVLI